MATADDISIRKERDGTLTVSSPLTRGRAATVDFMPDGNPFIVWAVNKSYRNGITADLILSALPPRG